MTRDVLVSVRGLHFMSGETYDTEDSEPIEMITAGEHYLKNGVHYILYDEVYEGFDETSRNLVKIGENTLEVRKKGLIQVDMIFEENKKNISFYATPFGTMRMGVAATRVRVKETETDIHVRAEYALEMNEEHVGDCYLEMDIKSKTAGDFSLS